jgi:Xaa-Pro dipeptidase
MSFSVFARRLAPVLLIKHHHLKLDITRKKPFIPSPFHQIYQRTVADGGRLRRISALRTELQKQQLEAYLVTDVKSIYYLTGFLDIAGASLSLLIPSQGESTLLTMPLSFDAALAQTHESDVKSVQAGESMVQRLLKELQTQPPRRLGYEGLSLKTFLELSTSLPETEYVASDLVANQRMIKDSEEIVLIRRACELADIGISVASQAIKVGVREYEVAAQAEYAMRIHGSQGFAFETLVASGPRSSYPHGSSTDREIREGEFVTVDLGSVWGGYCSDITRTVLVGSPSPKDVRLLRLVQWVHDKMLEEIRSGVEGASLDASARRMFGEDYRSYFIHGLGHGVGLDIHEPPTLSQASKDILAEGNVVTDEPGLYLKDHGGVRIEDTVLVTTKGMEKLTKAPYAQA